MDRQPHSPVGQAAQTATETRPRRSRAYRNARDEYARIRDLRQTNPIAAHLRERRFELGLTQEQVADAAGTSQRSRRIAAVLDEELLLCFQRVEDGELEREFAAVLA